MRTCGATCEGQSRSPSPLDQRQAGADGALGGVLVRLRIAEIDQHAVAHEAGDEAAEAG